MGTRIPLIIRDPSATPGRTAALVESVDIFPTLVQLAGLSPLEMCSPGPTDKQPVLCTEGLSAAPLFANPKKPWKKAAFSQYARPAPDPDNGFPAGAFTPPLHSGPVLPPNRYYPQERGRVRTAEGVMSFTMRVDNWRYTEHVWFDPVTATPHWNQSWGVELYEHTVNGGVPDGSFTDENENVAAEPAHASLVASLSAQLHAGWRSALPPAEEDEEGIDSNVALKIDDNLAVEEIFVDPEGGEDDLQGRRGGRTAPLRTVHAAATHVAALRARQPDKDIVVQLLPGVHHVGDTPLTLGPEHGGSGKQWVTWRSADSANPAIVGAPIRISGWKPHPTNKKALSAPLPSNVTKGTALRQFWANGRRAERPVIYGTGRQPGDNRQGYCLNLTNATATHMYPEGSQFDFSSEPAVDPTKWANPGDVEFVYTSCDAINCWIEPRCTVESVKGSLVSLKQDGNASCYHRRKIVMLSRFVCCQPR